MGNMARVLLAAGALCLLAGSAAADDIVVGVLTYSNVKIESVSDGGITFIVPATQVRVSKRLVEVNKVVLADAGFNQSEDLLAAGKLDEAAKAYAQAAKGLPNDWRQALVKARLVQVADQKEIQRVAAMAAAIAGSTTRGEATTTAPAVPPAFLTSEPADAYLNPVDRWMAGVLTKGNFGNINVPAMGNRQAVVQELTANAAAIKDFIANPVRPIDFLVENLGKRSNPPEYMDFDLVDKTTTREGIEKILGKPASQREGAFLEAAGTHTPPRADGGRRPGGPGGPGPVVTANRNVQVLLLNYDYMDVVVAKDTKNVTGFRLYVRKFVQAHEPPLKIDGL